MTMIEEVNTYPVLIEGHERLVNNYLVLMKDKATQKDYQLANMYAKLASDHENKKQVLIIRGHV